MKKLNMRRQEKGEPVDSFITSLYRLAEHCNYHDLNDEMIQDRIVVGLWDSNLSDRLQTDPELTFNKAITMAWWKEAVREQQAVVRGMIDNICTRIKVVEQSYLNKKLWTTVYVPSQQNSKQSTRKEAPDVARFQHIQVPGLWRYMP